jgi:hypothetical protein
MKTTVSKSNFHDAFRRADRTDNFSYEALDLLFDYFEEMEADTGEEIELDVIAICCEYEENDLDNIIGQYDELEDDATEDDVIEFLQYNTQYIGKTSCGLVYASF